MAIRKKWEITQFAIHLNISRLFFIRKKDKYFIDVIELESFLFSTFDLH